MREIKIEVRQRKIETTQNISYEVTVEDEQKYGKVNLSSKEKSEGFLEGFKFLRDFLNLDVSIEIKGLENPGEAE
jgi:hypothetical protein